MKRQILLGVIAASLVCAICVAIVDVWKITHATSSRGHVAAFAIDGNGTMRVPYRCPPAFNGHDDEAHAEA